MWNRKAVLGLLVGLTSLFAGFGQANACDARGTCLGIQWCLSVNQGREYAGPIADAIKNGDANGIGVDTAACQHKYGQGGWDRDSAGCNATDYTVLGKKALGGPAACDQ
jgi:hypothetical protein